MRTGLLAAWLVVAGLIVRLLVGSDPGGRLVLILGVLAGLWTCLVLTALAMAGGLSIQAWLAGREWSRRLARYQTRLRISGGLSLHGGSAGLAFCLNTLLATYRSHPRVSTHSWLWERFFRNLRLATNGWAATGIVSAEGRVERVAMEPKIRACLRHHGITDILTPWQPEARQGVIDGLTSESARASAQANTVNILNAGMTRAFASQKQRLRSHRCRHAAQSILAVGDFTSVSQLSSNILALGVSIIMLVALPDIRNMLDPPPPPALVSPSSPSPYYLWISLDTKRPEAFDVVLESGFWSNRRAEVAAYAGPDGSVRAEMRLNRLGRQTSVDEEDGTVWIERRRKLLGREYESGERVGSYSFSYISRLGHE